MRRLSLVVVQLAWALVACAAVTLACDGLRLAEPNEAGAGDGGEEEDGATPADDDGGTSDSDAAAKKDSSAKKRTVEVLVSGVDNPLEITLTSDTVFFTLDLNSEATVRKVKKNGTGSEIVSPHDPQSGLNPIANDIVVVGPDVIWANGTASAGRILAAPVAGGAERTIKSSVDSPYHLAHYGGNLYFVDRALSPSTYAIQRLPVGGGTPVPLEDYQIRVGGIAVDSSGVYWTHGGPLANGKNGVRRQPLDSPDATVDLNVGASNAEVGGLALGANEVFWADTEGGRIKKVGKTGGLTTVLADSLEAPLRVVLSGGYVYFSQHGLTTEPDGKVSRVPAAGGAVEDLATGLNHPVGVAVDATHVYWTSYGAGEIARTQK